MALTRAKKLKKPKDYTPQRKVAQIEYRRGLIARLMLQGADNQTILATLLTHTREGKPAPLKISERQLIEDRKAVDALIADSFKDQTPQAAARHYAELQNIHMEFHKAATDAKRAGDLTARVKALSGARQTVMDAAKLVGAVVEKHEVSGIVDHRHLHRMLTPEEAAQVFQSMQEASISQEKAVAMLVAPEPTR